MRNNMRTMWITVAALICMPAFAESDLTVEIVVSSVQSSLHGPDPFESRGAGLMRGFSFILFGSSDFLHGIAEAPGVVAEPETEVRERVHPVHELARKYDYSEAVNGLLNDLDFDAPWTMIGLHTMQFIEDGTRTWRTKDTAKQLLNRSVTDVALFFNFVYFITPDLRQVRLIADLKGYRISRNKMLSLSLSRRYEFLGPAQDIVLRPWRPGEREALVESIEAYFQDKLARYPQNETAYRKDKRLALQEIANTDSVPASIGMPEGWPENTLPEALKDATRHMTRMIKSDLHTLLRDENDPGKRVSFTALSEKGKPRQVKGHLIDTFEGNLVYRLRGGNLVSVPEGGIGR